MTGTYNAPSDFNHRTTWNSLKDFYKILDQVHESCWEQALTFDSIEDGTESHIDKSMLSAFHVDFYLSLSSPTHDA
jgi:hypothetical protein